MDGMFASLFPPSYFSFIRRWSPIPDGGVVDVDVVEPLQATPHTHPLREGNHSPASVLMNDNDYNDDDK